MIITIVSKQTLRCHIIHKPVNIRRAEVTVTAYIYPIFAVWQVGYLLHHICSVVGYERGTAEMVGVVVEGRFVCILPRPIFYRLVQIDYVIGMRLYSEILPVGLQYSFTKCCFTLIPRCYYRSASSTNPSLPPPILLQIRLPSSK